MSAVGDKIRAIDDSLDSVDEWAEENDASDADIDGLMELLTTVRQTVSDAINEAEGPYDDHELTDSPGQPPWVANPAVENPGLNTGAGQPPEAVAAAKAAAEAPEEAEEDDDQGPLSELDSDEYDEDDDAE